MSNNLVSVIIPTVKGREHYLERAIASVKNQTYKNIELIVINEGKPAPEQRNIGMERAKGDYIAFLDDDDLWSPQKIEKQMKVMESEGVDFVVCSYYDERINAIREPKARSSNDLLLSFSNFETSTILFKKELYNKAGGMDIRFKSEQNHELFYRFSKVGAFSIIEEPLMIKGYDGSSIGTNRMNKLQGYILFHWKFKKDILKMGIAKTLFMLSKFLITILLFMLVGNPTKLYEKVKIW